MFKNIIRVLGGDPNRREIERLIDTVVSRVNALEDTYEDLNDEQLLEKTGEFRQRLADGETLDDLMPEAFAAVREAAKRHLGQRHYDVQLVCGAVLHQGKIAEMRTGEGKTLAATLALYLNALEGKGAHLVTVNDYLARRDARWMAPIFIALGMRVGVLQMASRTDSGKRGFLVDLERTSPHEDRDQLLMVPRKEAYAADITYGTNSEFGFDYLRDNQVIDWEERVQRGHHYAIIDEVDNVLIDEARTPLIISGPASDDTQWYVQMAQIVDRLRPEDYEVSERDRSVSLTEIGEAHVEELLDMPLRDPERPEDITPEQARILGYLEQSLRAKHLYKRNKDYLVQSGRVIIIDSSTGRLMPGRRWSEGLHQAVEAKEGVRINPENVTYATITLQNYYRMYEKLSGMTGTAITESEEFDKIYKLAVLPILTNLEYIVSRQDSELEELKTRDDQGYEYGYYSLKEDQSHEPVFWRRKDYTDVVYRTTEAKLRAIAEEVIRLHIIGRPQLVGTTSVENSEVLSRRLQSKSVRTLLQVLLLRDIWMEVNKIDIVDRSNPALNPLNESLDDINPGKLRAVARDLNIKLSLNLEDQENVDRLMKIFDLEEEHRERLLDVIKGGVPHNVLNARKHDEEAKLIAFAGSFGAVTIATNMAGRGVDIKLGGELPENVVNDVVRVLENRGYDAYEMSLDERLQALEKVPIEELSVVRAESIHTFLQYARHMQKVKELGGLHVVGSERYEARRIDNQLRGRSARQGDPGSSRFYLSLEDDLMRLFGGQQVESLWGRVFMDDSQPLEMRILGRIVEQSQERVEGANFDARKHVLEYDDVLNTQRNRIYTLRDRAFQKEDLSEDVLDMLRTELHQRIPAGLSDEEGPWKLIAFLEQIQPPFEFEGISYPSFALRLLMEEIRQRVTTDNPAPEELRAILLDIADKSLLARKEHLMNATKRLLDAAADSLERQLDERYDTLDTYLGSISDMDEMEESPSPSQMLAQISEYVQVPIKLESSDMRSLAEGDDDVVEELRQQIEAHFITLTLRRVVGALERRLDETLDLPLNELQQLPWREVFDRILESVDLIFDQQMQRLLGDKGQIAADLDSVWGRINGNLLDERILISLLMLITQGSRLTFDRRTHQRRTQQYTRLTYLFYVAQIMAAESKEKTEERILTHLENALERLQLLRGVMEWKRLAQSEFTPGQFDENIRSQLVEEWGLERFEEIADSPFPALQPDEQILLRDILGKRLQNETYREILVRVISSQWVDYLTEIEALRVSIGLEAYAQRDPLVQYKSKASEMFQGLLAEIRMGVITRVFTYQARKDASVAVARERPMVEVSADGGDPPVQQDESQKRKKKRRRH
jgi:preprotein translocase subunit SecA